MRNLTRRLTTALGILLVIAPAVLPLTPAQARSRAAAAGSRLGSAGVGSSPRDSGVRPAGGSGPFTDGIGVASGVAAWSELVGGPPVDGFATRFGWPLPGTPRPVRRFDPPPRPWLSGHRGVDLAGVPGGQVRASGDGVILFSGMVAGRPVVTVGHAGGLRSTYEPVRSGLPSGTRVGVGTPIGVLLAGHPGCPAEACLHWGLRQGEEYLDPLTLLGLGKVRLLPLGPAAVVPAAGGSPTQPRASSAGRRTASRSYSSGVL